MKTILFVWVIAALGLGGAFAQEELQLRSAEYDGVRGVSSPYQASYTASLSMTVEAWVYRERDNEVETIISQGFQNAFWFGFSNAKLRFSRSGGIFENSTGEVRRNQWTHVAASYDGANVRFYINGVPAGVRALSHSGNGTTDPIRLGRDAVISSPFEGRLDEVRLWSQARNGSQITAGLYAELRDIANLEGVWPRGDGREVVHNTLGTEVVSLPPLLRNGILPRELVVPRSPTVPTFDGNVDISQEYAGAEEVVIRYDHGPNFADATAYLVHRGNYLYVGVRGARLPSSGGSSPDNVVTAYIDSEGETTSLNSNLKQGRVFLQDGLTGYSQVETRSMGTPPFVFTFTGWFASTPSATTFGAMQGTSRLTEFGELDMEFRFNRSLLGEFADGELDRFALSHTNNGGPNGDRWAPEGGDGNAPATWTEMRYSSLTGTDLPRVLFTGEVRNPLTNDPVPGVVVNLRGFGVQYGSRTTSDTGYFEFAWPTVGQNVTLELALTVPDGARVQTPQISSINTQPSLISPPLVRFPGCQGGNCRYAFTKFLVEQPLGETTLGSFSPESAWPRVQTRSGASPKWVEAAVVTVTGTNLHDSLEFFFAKSSCPNSLAGCVEGVDYFPAVGTYHAADGDTPARYDVTVPEIPVSAWGSMRLTAHDVWSRPDNSPLSVTSWKNFADQIIISPPPYAQLHGFAFENEADGHDIDDYRAAFYDQVCNPFFMVGFWAYAPIYLSVLGGGECVGMTVTAQQYFKGRPAGPIDPDVIHGSGFLTGGGTAAPKPATFNVSNPCSPAPTNVWAAIRANHGVQMSSEFFGKTLEQFTVGRGLISININDQLNKLRPRPLDYMVCIRNGDKGHCVQPLRVIDIDATNYQIEIWDCNFPNQTRTIDVDTRFGGTYTYDGSFEGGPWEGNWLMVYEIAPIYDNERHAPSLDVAGYALGQFGVTHLWEFFQLFVSGDAEPLITAGDGSQTGWDAGGNFLEDSAQTMPIPNFNWIPGDAPSLGHYPVSMLHRMDEGAPETVIHNKGDSYKLHSSHHGTMFQMFVEGGKVGAVDKMSCDQTGERVMGINFEAGIGAREVEARIALCRNANEYPLAVSISQVTVPETQSIGLETLPDGTGFHFDNDTKAGMTPQFDLVVPTAQGPDPDLHQTPSLSVPAGARLNVSSPDGVDFRNLIFSVDYDRDGAAEDVMQFVSDTGTFVPYVAPWMEIERLENGDLVLTYPEELEDWAIQESDTMEDQWGILDTSGFSSSTGKGVVSMTVPAPKATKRFYRLFRKD